MLGHTHVYPFFHPSHNVSHQIHRYVCMYMGSSIEFALGLPLGLRSSAHMSFACRVPDLSSPPTDTRSTAAWKSPEPNRLVGVAVFSATRFTGYAEYGRKPIVKASGGAADGDLGESPPPASAATASSSSWEGRAACYVCIETRRRAHACLSVCQSVFVSVCLSSAWCVHTCTRTLVYVCDLYKHMYVCTHVCMYVHTYYVRLQGMCVHACVYFCMVPRVAHAERQV